MATPTTAHSTLSPSSNRQGAATQLRQFKITDIPAAMDKMNWPVAAALMRHWFQGDPWPTADGGMSREVKSHNAWPNTQYIEESIVRMSWVLCFERAQAAVTELRQNWNNEKAIPFIHRNILREFRDKETGSYRFSFPTASAAEKFGYFNYRKVTFAQVGDDEINELRGALANFNMRVIAEGTISTSKENINFTAQRLGFYIEDSYDFNDGDDWISQPLGFWSFDGMARSAAEAALTNTGVDQSSIDIAQASIFGMSEEMQKAYVDLNNSRYFLVQNSHFIKYREKHHKGGDFRIFSDIHYENLPYAVTINIPKQP